MSWTEFFSAPMAQLLARRKGQELRRYNYKPHIGATIVCADLRMSVQAGMSNDLWRWLVAHGWRELENLKGRGRLRAFPASSVTALFDSPPERWESLLAAAIKQATYKPTIERSAVRAAA